MKVFLTAITYEKRSECMCPQNKADYSGLLPLGNSHFSTCGFSVLPTTKNSLRRICLPLCVQAHLEQERES